MTNATKASRERRKDGGGRRGGGGNEKIYCGINRDEERKEAGDPWILCMNGEGCVDSCDVPSPGVGG